ncbi:MAG: MetQ/NlpA family ABC transporter substrate-binding protein [Planctomycetota bacterium]|jgi:D-methionine transport system substrate-binding protein|nr:MetQ/NlpA family ABC transporter substrate-binding protein [Planctomycetota bacterium]
MRGLLLGLLLLSVTMPVWAGDKIVVGTTAGADVEIIEKARDVAARDGLEVQIIEFSDYVRPNLALADGEIDVNSFQHQPYLDSFAAEHNLQLVAIGNTYVSPIGYFSTKIKSLDQLKDGDSLAIPNDPTNGGRSLLLLEKAGFIKLRQGSGLTATPYDVVENRLNLKIIEVDAAQTPRSLDDVAAAAINNTFAIPAGLNPLRDSIYLEDRVSPYVNIIVSRTADRDNPVYLRFVKAYQSKEVAEFILSRFEGATVPAFDY